VDAITQAVLFQGEPSHIQEADVRNGNFFAKIRL
jgi:hypothetical protein